ncbi:hypothetical protein WMY93_032793 [Mugilogobius chulae]|uniref:CCR4-NOT transcription complex subunit 9 n=1 Tax=Mugilogobius chulae TaxID=88201 RepID=A0AAW0MVS6_9GOBI
MARKPSRSEDYFKMFFSDNILSVITEQSNLYAIQCNPSRPLNLSTKELEQFIATRMFWSKASRVHQVADTMSLNRWEAIKKALHFNDMRQYQQEVQIHFTKSDHCPTESVTLWLCCSASPHIRNQDCLLGRSHSSLLYPFLHTVSKTRPFEYLRLTSLGVIGALVKTDEQEVINFLLTTEIIPLCLRIMEAGSELSKTVATFILQKILLDDTGLAYICQTYERFSHVAMILGKMVLQLSKEPSARLLKHVVRCYLRLSDNSSQRSLRQCLPDQLKDTTFAQVLKDDTTTKRWLAQLVKNLQEGQVTDPRGIPLTPQ